MASGSLKERDNYLKGKRESSSSGKIPAEGTTFSWNNRHYVVEGGQWVEFFPSSRPVSNILRSSGAKNG